MVSDVGQNQMWVAQYYRFTRPRTYLSSGGLGTMGFGFPAAIGAQVANPGKLVINVSGDGGIQMNIQELATAVLNDLPVKVFILNNGYLGMVRQWQQMFYKNVYSSTNLTPQGVKRAEGQKEMLHDYIPDFVKVAEAYGAVGMRVTEKDDVESAIRTALSTPKCVVVEFRVTQEENVFPMVPAGASLSQVITGRFSKSSVLAS
jgi:acetolactate synthase-1/2/3 large subunit